MQTSHDLPANVNRVLEDFIAAARQICGDTLRSVVLYGSGAEGRLRATSDVNLILTLTEFTPQIADALREPLRVSQAVAQMSEPDREMLLMRHAEELTYDDIGALLDISAATARKRYGRALLRLRKVLSQWGLLETSS